MSVFQILSNRSVAAALLCAVTGLVGGCGDDAPGAGNNQNQAGSDAAVDGAVTPDGAVAPDAGPGDGGVEADAGPTRPRWQGCDQDPVPVGLPLADWEHWYTPSLVTSQGDPDHSAQDVITVVDRAVSIVGKFAYGPFSKDLQDERIEVYLDVCQGQLVRLGEALTDSDGRIALELAAPDVPPVGAYATWLRVMGDGSHTRSTLRVVMPGTRAAVMDIDGTLTTSDTELFQDIFADLFAPLGTGDYVPVARAGGVDLTRRRGTQQGYLLVYMTGRPYYLTDITREWIANQALAPAHLHVTDSNGEALPTEGGVGTYKADYLAYLQSLGILLELAYGNASTDIYAYEQAGIDKAATFITGSNGGDAGTVAVGDDYVQHLLDIAGEPPITQPFDW